MCADLKTSFSRSAWPSVQLEKGEDSSSQGWPAGVHGLLLDFVGVKDWVSFECVEIEKMDDES